MKDLPPELVMEILLYSLPEDQYHLFLDIPRIPKKYRFKKFTHYHQVKFFRDIIESRYFKLRVTKLIEYKYQIDLNFFKKKRSMFIKGGVEFKKQKQKQKCWTKQPFSCKPKYFYPKLCISCYN